MVTDSWTVPSQREGGIIHAPGEFSRSREHRRAQFLLCICGSRAFGVCSLADSGRLKISAVWVVLAGQASLGSRERPSCSCGGAPVSALWLHAQFHRRFRDFHDHTFPATAATPVPRYTQLSTVLWIQVCETQREVREARKRTAASE